VYVATLLKVYLKMEEILYKNMDGNSLGADFTCVRTAYASYCFAILFYFLCI